MSAMDPPVTGFVTFDRGTHRIYGTGYTVEEAREQAVDAIREACMSRNADHVRARRQFTAAVRDLTTSAATAALIDAVARGQVEAWEIHLGAACTHSEVHGIDPVTDETGMRPT